MSSIHADEVQRFLTIMNQLADLSAKEIEPFFRGKLSVENKKLKRTYDPVTMADRNAEQVIRDFLAQNLPSHAIIGEEFGTKEQSSEHCWVIDPIDGTRAFIMGSPLWGTLIGLNYQNEPIIGLMNQPFTKERFWASPEGAFARWEGYEGPIETRQTTTLDSAIITSTCPDLFASAQDFQAFEKLRSHCQMTRYGGDCYSYCLLAMGSIDLVVETGLQTYDIAPLVPIVRQAGGVISNWQGKDPGQGGQIIAAATQELHAKAIDILTS